MEFVSFNIVDKEKEDKSCWYRKIVRIHLMRIGVNWYEMNCTMYILFKWKEEILC